MSTTQSIPPKVIKLVKAAGDDVNNNRKIKKPSIQPIGDGRRERASASLNVNNKKILIKSKTKNEDTHISEIFSLLKSYYQKRDNKDNCSVFGEHIANKLRNYDLLTRAEVEYKINCILHEADLKVLQGSYTSLYQTISQTVDIHIGGSRSAICIGRNK